MVSIGRASSSFYLNGSTQSRIAGRTGKSRDLECQSWKARNQQQVDEEKKRIDIPSPYEDKVKNSQDVPFEGRRGWRSLVRRRGKKNNARI